MQRSILYIEMDALAASIEQRDRPQLRGKPVAVTRPGPRDGAHEVVGTASHEARRSGVREGASVKLALQRCPDLVLVSHDAARDRVAAQQVHAILGDFSRRVEALSMESCWVDVTDGTNVPGLGGATAVARRVRERVRSDLGLTCSIGVAPLKFVARLASQHRTPDGLTVVPPDHVSSFVHPLAVERLEGIDRVTARRLHARGIHTIGDLAKQPEAGATALLGRQGLAPWRLARGSDPRRVSPDRSPRARSVERTFPVDVYEATILEREVDRQIEQLANEMSNDDARARALTVRVRYATYEIATRSRTFEPATRDPARLSSSAKALLHDRTDVGSRPVRLVGVSIAPPTPHEPRTSTNRRV